MYSIYSPLTLTVCYSSLKFNNIANVAIALIKMKRRKEIETPYY